MDVTEMKEKLLAIDMAQECEDAFNANTDYSEDLNRQQLSAGVKADGSLLPDEFERYRGILEWY